MRPSEDGRTDRAASALRIIAAGVLLVSTVHYLDNWIRWDDYVFSPNGPIKIWMVPVVWVLLTAFGVVGFVRFARGRWWSAGISLAIYSLIGLVDGIHYTDAPPADFDVLQNVTIVGNLVTGVAMLGFAGWLIVWRAVPRSDGSIRTGNTG